MRIFLPLKNSLTNLEEIDCVNNNSNSDIIDTSSGGDTVVNSPSLTGETVAILTVNQEQSLHETVTVTTENFESAPIVVTASDIKNLATIHRPVENENDKGNHSQNIITSSNPERTQIEIPLNSEIENKFARKNQSPLKRSEQLPLNLFLATVGEGVAPQETKTSKKQSISSTELDTSHTPDLNQSTYEAEHLDLNESFLVTKNTKSSHHSKRPRPDSKSSTSSAKVFRVDRFAKSQALKYAEQPLTQLPSDVTEDNMTGGGCGRLRYSQNDDDDDEKRESWINNRNVKLFLTPAENRPPALGSSDPAGAVGTETSVSPTFARKTKRMNPLLENGPEMVAVLKNNRKVPESDPTDRMALFCLELKKLGLEVVEQEGDGNCLFRAVSLQVFGHADQHADVRERCLDFMASNAEHYSNFVAAEDYDDHNPAANLHRESFEEYIKRKRYLGVHGNHAEIQAISELFNRPVEVYTPDDLRLDSSTDTASTLPKLKPMNIFHTEYKTSDVPIRLSYHDGNHYNAIIDPLVPTAGLGLGLPGLQPGLADKMQVAAAVTESDHLADQMELERVLRESAQEHNDRHRKDRIKQRSTEDEDDDLQRALKESAYSSDYSFAKKAMVLSDLDATNFDLEQEALAESWDTYAHQEHGCKPKASAIAAASRIPSPSFAASAMAANRRRPRSVSGTAAGAAAAASNPVYPEETSPAAIRPPPAAAAAAASVASAAASSASSYNGDNDFDYDRQEYTPNVQELVMNGFELKEVLRAYELVGDNFDDLLAFLLSTTSSS